MAERPWQVHGPFEDGTAVRTFGGLERALGSALALCYSLGNGGRVQVRHTRTGPYMSLVREPGWRVVCRVTVNGPEALEELHAAQMTACPGTNIRPSEGAGWHCTGCGWSVIPNYGPPYADRGAGAAIREDVGPDAPTPGRGFSTPLTEESADGVATARPSPSGRSTDV